MKLLLVSGLWCAHAGHADLRRARVKVPSDAHKGDDQVHMSKVLNGHLAKSEPNSRPCDEWGLAALQEFMGTVAGHRSQELIDIYADSSDKRQPTFSTYLEHFDHWKEVNKMAKKNVEFEVVARESHCRQAVMWWVHHLTDEKRQALRKNLVVPMLPEGTKKDCEGDSKICVTLNKENSCDWCHSTQARHDAGDPGATVPDALKYTDGPDDGNPHGWDRLRRCDQNQMPRCQLCEGIGGEAWADNNSAIKMTPCKIIANASDVDPKTVAPPLYPKKFTVRRKDGMPGGYTDTLIGWKLPSDSSCFSFFPQNDSIGPLCYRNEEASVKYYDIEKEAARTDYSLASTMTPTNTTSTILQRGWQMWVVNRINDKVDQCVCTNPSGQHCTEPPCYSYLWRWNTFETAQYLGREEIGVEWIDNHGTGNSSKKMELDHFIMWAHHIWTDPQSKRLVRAWKPFNGLQVYDPEAWEDDVEDESVFDIPPAICKKPTDPDLPIWRIHCDDDGNYDGTPPPPEGIAGLMAQQMQQILTSLDDSHTMTV
jgi:hypothetical protein